MPEKPILFNGDMVRAIRGGLKTQTRRAVKPYLPPGCSPECLTPATYCPMRVDRKGEQYPGEPVFGVWGDDWGRVAPCAPGDTLWVRETWAEVGSLDPGILVYRASYPACVPSHLENIPDASGVQWKPSIHMPRRAARIFLAVTAVRFERVGDITEADALAEGIMEYEPGLFHWAPFAAGVTYYPTARAAFLALWDSLYGPGNPWVWVIEFRMKRRAVAVAAGRQV
ncbi:MAG: hypothetical protein RL077_347 [Verrucomicrobiota bacterium]|jgi:hypothetical protein